MTTRSNAIGVDSARKSKTSNVLRPTRRAPGISRLRARFGVTGGAASIAGDGRTASYRSGVGATVLIDGENVRRSMWPNIPRRELEDLTARWAEQHGHDARVVWERGETADDSIARSVRELEPPVWVVTSDGGLRERVLDHVERVIGGGSFARELRAS